MASAKLPQELTCTIHPFGEMAKRIPYTFVGIFAFENGRLLLSRKAGRATWEPQGGHVEPGETPEQAARRELYEECGALEYTLHPLCDYFSEGTSGACFVAEVTKRGPLPPFEMEEVWAVDALPPPEQLTYPGITPFLLAEYEKKTHP